MVSNQERLQSRERQILAGLFLSKYDLAGVKRLGFGSFTAAFNVVGYALGAKPSSIKNYRDEFDPLFSNRRRGWHKRPTREYCLKVFQQFKDLDFETFSCLIRSFFGYDANLEIPEASSGDSSSFFARRLITGLAAEKYFEANHKRVPEFRGYDIENTTLLGCGYDFRLRGGRKDHFIAVEVKGLEGRKGSVSLTSKEHTVAGSLSDNFFLFVVRNFRETPFHEVYKNPLASKLQFARNERVLVHVSWQASV